jgi:predicted extracellular nuclease
VVTLSDPGSGFYIEDLRESAGKNSRAMFVRTDSTQPRVRTGQVVQVSGRVAEIGERRDTMTALIDVTQLEACQENAPLPATRFELPKGNRARESFEGMRLAFPQEFVVNDVYRLRDGTAGLAANHRLWSPTEVAEPGPRARDIDESNRERSLHVRMPASPATTLASGTRISGLTGVMGHDGRYPLLFAETGIQYRQRDLPILEEPLAGGLRVINANLHNFFNGNGRGGGFPTRRGAKTRQAYTAQKQRLAAAMNEMQPDLLAVQELENDGFGAHSAASDLLELLTGAAGGDWRVVALPGNGIGPDEIAVGLFYRSEKLEPLGPPATLDTPPFDDLSRQPLAQLFRDRRSGKPFLVTATHLKSKGGCPRAGENRDREDGQGCWNPARSEAVQDLTAWLGSLASSEGTPYILVLGDMNALRREDPIREFLDAGYVDVVEQLNGLPQYTFVYRGRAGTLDYAFASPGLARFVRQAQIWHINADWPPGFDMPAPWLRMSDHDPVIVDFDFNQRVTSD